MGMPTSRWRVALYLNDFTELVCATVELVDEVPAREIVRMITGPFDSPEEIVATIVELVEHANWHGEQLRLPVSMDEQ